MLSKFKLAHKFIIMSLVQLLMIIVTSWVSIAQMSKIGHEIEEIAYDHLPLTKTLTLITEHQLQQAILVEKVISHALLDELNGEGISQESINLANDVVKKLDELHDEILESEKLIEDLLGKVTLAESVERYEAVLDEYRKAKDEFLVLEELIASFINKLKTQNVSQIYKDIYIVEQSNDQLDEHLIEILSDVQDFTEQSADKAYKDEVAALRTILTVAAIAIAFAIIIPFFIGKSILDSLKKLLERLDDLVSGDGDLTIRMKFKSKDELGDVANKLDRFMDKLSKTIFNISKSSMSLNTSSESAITVIQNTLSSVEKQSSETSLVANAVAEMNSATSNVAESTLEASNLANQVKSVVTKGKAVAEENQRISRQLTEEVQNTSESLRELADETENIGAVLDTIQSIAEQTNLLALNAAIEAARAGDSGRGFAVVADEVRSLAQKTQDSTIDIQNLVEKLQSGAESAMVKMNKGVDITAKCLEIAKETAGHFDSAVDAVTNIADLNNQVATASEQQSTIAAQVQKNIGNIDGISQNTKRDAEQVAKANEDIAVNIISLNTDLNQFKVENY